MDIFTDHHNLKPTASLLDDSCYNFLVSVTHEKQHAVAVVVSEKIT